tara:strand:+ start:543 stop:1160 length:618 start_codon:yes stop_codon:yes gene_type:complete
MPTTRTNRVNNPSFENDTASSGVTPSNWTNYHTSGSLTYKGPATDWSNYGSKSWKISSTTNIDSGIKKTITGLTPGATVYVSGYIKVDSVVGDAHWVIADTSAGGGNLQGAAFSGTGELRWLVQKTVPGSGQVTIFIGLGSFYQPSRGTAWFDGICLVQGGENTDRYIDGSLYSPLYTYGWNGTAHASTSYETTKDNVSNFFPFF